MELWLIFFMKLKVFFYRTPLSMAVQNKNVEIVKLLLSSPEIDVNLKNISKNILYKYNCISSISIIF